jgi:MFS family permease
LLPKYIDLQLVSIYNIGCLIGAFINVFVGEWSGRRKAIWAAMFLITLGAVLQCSAFNVSSSCYCSLGNLLRDAQVGQLMLGRVITGIGVGIDNSTVPI